MVAWNRAQHVAARALSGTVMASVGNATHFHTINVQPIWGPNLLRVAQVGLHVFYKFGRNAPTSYADGGPEMTAHPVFASVAAPGLAAAASPTELRLASALVTESPNDAPAGLRGPVEQADAAQPEAKAAAQKAAEAPKSTPVKMTPASQPRAEPVKAATATAS